MSGIAERSMGIRFIAPVLILLTLALSTWYSLSGIHAANKQHEISHAAVGARAEINHLAALENGAEAGEIGDLQDVGNTRRSLEAYLETLTAGVPDDATAALRRDAAASRLPPSSRLVPTLRATSPRLMPSTTTRPIRCSTLSRLDSERSNTMPTCGPWTPPTMQFEA